MRADYIKEIISEYIQMPYECILIDGTWGIGKTYVVKDALKEYKNVCYISAFGMKDAQQIFHEAFYQFGLKDKKRLRNVLSKLIDIIGVFYNKIGIAKQILDSVIQEKELFLELTNKFKSLHIIVIDDMERRNENVSLEELFGTIEEIKKCNYVKVILIANTREIKNKEIFNKYIEKVIDRTYQMTEHMNNIEWRKMNIHCGFIKKFLNEHKVQNLRTLQKAQNLYDDVRLRLKDGYKDDFYEEIKLACYAIVVESTDQLYYREKDTNQKDSIINATFDITNQLAFRIKNHYLSGERISGNMVDMLQMYYENQRELVPEEIDGEYQIFLHAGEKANFYKTDEELKVVLPEFEEKIKTENNIGLLMKYADEYLIWSRYLEIDTTEIVNIYERKVHDIVYVEAMNGKLDYLSYGLEMHIQSEINQGIIKKLIQNIREEIVKSYIQYLSQNIQGEMAYQYSYRLRQFTDSSYYREIVFQNIDNLYNEKSFPIKDVTDATYRTSYNIMYVMCEESQDKFLAYCDDIKKKCDHMAAHRIDVLVKEITEKKRYSE